MSDSEYSIKSIFCQALEQQPKDRAAFLDSICGKDSDVRREVDALLKIHDELGTFMEESPLMFDDLPSQNNSDKSDD